MENKFIPYPKQIKVGGQRIEVRFIRNFNGGYKACAAILGKEMTCATYHQIIKRKSYKDVV